MAPLDAKDEKLTVMLTEADMAKLRSMAAADDVSVSDFSRKLLRQEFDRRLSRGSDATRRVQDAWAQFADFQQNLLDRVNDAGAKGRRLKTDPKAIYAALDALAHADGGKGLQLKDEVKNYREALRKLFHPNILDEQYGKARADWEQTFDVLKSETADWLDSLRAADIHAASRRNAG